jgi:hypothetical protein
LTEFRELIVEYDSRIHAHSTLILGSQDLNEAIRQAYMKREHDSSGIVKHEKIEWIANWLVNSYNPDFVESKPEERLNREVFLTLIVAHLAGARRADGLNEAEKAVWNDCTRDLADALRKDPWCLEFAQKSEAHFEKVRLAATDLSESLRQFRYDLCLRHNTHYQP